MSKKILIADDDPSICDSLKMMLEIEGYQVETMLDGEQMYKMKKEYPQLLLLDIWMSGEDGRDICKYWKKEPQTKHIPIIMISASKDIKQSAQEAGADDFISKPFDQDDLLQKIAKYIGTTV